MALFCVSLENTLITQSLVYICDCSVRVTPLRQATGRYMQAWRNAAEKPKLFMEDISKVEEFMLARILEQYFNWNGISPYYETRESIGRVNNMRIFIYSDDHNPPHFHVQSNDRNIDAKFKIENGEYIAGRIDQKDIKRIFAFYNDIKVKMLMERIWSKKNQ